MMRNFLFSSKVFDLDIYLFSFKWIKQGRYEQDLKSIEEKANKILTKFKPGKRLPTLSYDQDQSSYVTYLLSKPEQSTIHVARQQVNLDLNLLRIHDSFILFFSAYSSENKVVDISLLKKFNPHNILISDNRDRQNDYIGQVILITARLLVPIYDDSSLKELADQCYRYLLKNEPPEPEQGNLFGGIVFDYSNCSSTEDINSYTQVIVLLFPNKLARSIFEENQYSIIELCLSRSKIINVVENAKNSKYADDIKIELERIFRDIQKNFSNKNQKYVNDLKIKKSEDKIQEMLTLSWKHQYWSVVLQDCRNSIKINYLNYKKELARINQKIKKEYGISEPTSFLKIFSNQNYPKFNQYLEYSLNIAQCDENSINQTISLIRGLVEIEKAKNEKRLEREIQAIGVGAAFGAIIASSSGLMAPSWQEPFWKSPWKSDISLTNFDSSIHPFLLSLLMCVVVALFLYFSIKILLDRFNFFIALLINLLLVAFLLSFLINYMTVILAFILSLIVCIFLDRILILIRK